MRGLLRVLVVGFTVVSLLIVAAVGVSASSGKAGSDTLKNSVVALFSGHSEQTGDTAKTDKETGKDGNEKGGECKPPKKEHHKATPGHEHHPCGEDDSG